MAKTFTDSKGRTWEAVVTIGAARRFERATGLPFFDKATWSRLTQERRVDDICALAFAACKFSAKQYGVGAEEFGDQFETADLFRPMMEATLEALADFTQSLSQAEAAAGNLGVGAASTNAPPAPASNA